MDNEIMKEARDISRATEWAYLATSRRGQPTIRPIRVAWDSNAVWVACNADSPKMRHIAKDERVELFFHLTEALRHLTVTGTAEAVTDPADKKRVWGVFDFDLRGYYPAGPSDSNFGLMKITPSRIECWSLGEMRQGRPGRVWKS